MYPVNLLFPRRNHVPILDKFTIFGVREKSWCEYLKINQGREEGCNATSILRDSWHIYIKIKKTPDSK